VSVPSASVARAVMPTVVPLIASSATVLAAASLSETALTADSLMSVTLIVNGWLLVLVSDDVARTVTEWLVAVS